MIDTFNKGPLSAGLVNHCLYARVSPHNVIGWKRFNLLRFPLSGLPLPLLLV